MSELFRILHVVHIMNRGGMENRLMDQYRNLDRDRFQFDFYVESGKKGMFDSEIEQLGGRVFYADEPVRHGIPSFRAWKRFLIHHNEYQLVFAYNQWSGWYLREAKKQGIPTRVAFSRTSLQTFSRKNIVKNTVKQNVNRYATHKFAVSEKAGIWLFGKHAFENGKVTVWPNAIETEKYRLNYEKRANVRAALGLHDELAVMHVGNIRFEKNHPFLLKVFASILERKPEAKLFLVGNGSMDSLREELKSLRIQNHVCHLGVRTDVPELLMAADLFVFPSLYEGFPGAVLEAETSGLPCMISDTITDEVVLTERVKQVSLKSGSETWAEEATNSLLKERTDCVDKVKAAGYDIHDLTCRMEEFYLQCEGKDEQ